MLNLLIVSFGVMWLETTPLSYDCLPVKKTICLQTLEIKEIIITVRVLKKTFKSQFSYCYLIEIYVKENNNGAIIKKKYYSTYGFAIAALPASFVSYSFYLNFP